MQTQTTQMTEQGTTGKGPGSLLTDTRLKLGLDQKNVAEMLHLREHQIRALEEDDYDNLPEPTYVKGYLRAYAQLLSLEPEKVIGLYTDFVAPPVRESFEGIAPEKQAASNDNLVKMISIALVALVAGLAIIFWAGNSDEERESQPVADAVSPYQAPQAVAPADAPGTASEAAATPEVPTVTEPKPVEAETPTPAPPAVMPAKPVATPAPATVAKPAQPAPPVVEPQAVVTPGRQTSAGIKQETSLLPTTDNEIRTALVLKVTTTSWVDIRDARGNKLIYETVPAGREIPLEGLAPFSVFLGNADGVGVMVEGKAFDFSSFKRGLTARFKIARPAGSQ